MTKTEFLSASLPYGAKFINKGLYEDAVMLLHGIVFNEAFSQYGKFPIRDVKPIIRPLDSLTKECIQADYNDGKPFIPIIELAKLGQSQKDNTKYIFDEWYKDGIYYIAKCDSRKFIFDGDAFRYRDIWGNIHMAQNQMLLFHQLLKWHFYPNMPENEEVVYVNEEFNPYK
jgi:hypothetical protein